MLLIATLNASAESIKIHTTLDGWGKITPSFDINAKLGRAWVNLEIDDSPSDPDSSSYDERVKIEGLSYDVDTKEVIFTSVNGEITVCAKSRTRGRGIFRNTRIFKTNACKFKKGTEVRTIDDGYDIYKRKYQTITLEINE